MIEEFIDMQTLQEAGRKISLDYEQETNNWAIYLPALQNVFVDKSDNTALNSEYIDSMAKLNFLSSSQALFYYPYALVTVHNLSDKPLEKPFVTARNPASFLLCDSGGYQIRTGVWKADWKNNCNMAQLYRERAFNRMAVGNYGMCLDVPPLLISDGNQDKA